MFRMMMVMASLCLVLTALPATDCRAEREDSASAPSKKNALSQKAETEAPKRQMTKGQRLPKYYGRLKLDDEQREEVLVIQQKYEQQIAELQQQMESLHDQLAKDLAKVLNRDQRRTLKELVDAPRAKKSR